VAVEPVSEGSGGVLPEFLSLTQMADVLNITTRQVRNLVKKGLPVDDEEAGARRYPKRACQKWYIEFKEAAALARIERVADGDKEEADLRRAVADAKLAEIKVAKEEGKLIPVEQHEAVVAEIADRMTAVCLQVRGEYELDLERVGVPAAEGERILDRISEGLLRALRDAGTEMESEEDEDGSESDD
jgi:phage terminase Nu1 subunit (DNA packaging protein)